MLKDSFVITGGSLNDHAEYLDVSYEFNVDNPRENIQEREKLPFKM